MGKALPLIEAWVCATPWLDCPSSSGLASGPLASAFSGPSRYIANRCRYDPVGSIPNVDRLNKLIGPSHGELVGIKALGIAALCLVSCLFGVKLPASAEHGLGL